MPIRFWRQHGVFVKMNSGMQRLISSAIAPLLLLLLAGCGGAGGFPQPSSSAQLAVAPAALSFGSIGVGSSKTLSGTLKAARGTVTVSTAEWSGPGYALSGISFPVTIAEGHSIPFKVTFTPSASGAAKGILTFITDAAVSPASQMLSGSGASHLISLAWRPSSSPVIGYNIYRGTQSGGPYSRLNSSPISTDTYDDDGVQSGLTYFYVLRSVSFNSIESSASNQAAATVP
jgi:hypothetical protein